MTYDKIKQSKGYEDKKHLKGGHDIPLETIEEVIENPTDQETQDTGRKAYSPAECLHYVGLH